MATGNPFDLLGDDDNDEPSQLIAAQQQKIPLKKAIVPTQATAQQAQQQKPSKLPTKPLPPAEAVREAKNEAGRGGGHGGGFNRDLANNENSFNSSGFSAGQGAPEEADAEKLSERRGGYGGPHPSRGGRRGGFSNGEVGDGERPRRVFECCSGTGRGNDFKREGAGRGNWGTQTDELAQNLLRNLKHHKDEDLLKGQAVKNQKALWDKTLEFRFLLQKAFSSSNRLPQEPLRSSFCESDTSVKEAYSDLIASSKTTLDSLLELLDALLEKNPSITTAINGNSGKPSMHFKASRNSNMEGDEEWSPIFQMYSRIAPFRDKSVDKWQRKTQVTTGAAAIIGKLQAFNQNISEQVAANMRDPSRMIKGMQQRRSAVGIFGAVPDAVGSTKEEDPQADGDREIIDDSEFYHQLLKEFFATFDPTSSDTAFYAVKRLQTKKRKIVDRHASSRKIRYNVQEKIVNFMAPQTMDLPPMAPKLFENLFGLKTQKTSTAS